MKFKALILKLINFFQIHNLGNNSYKNQNAFQMAQINYCTCNILAFIATTASKFFFFCIELKLLTFNN